MENEESGRFFQGPCRVLRLFLRVLKEGEVHTWYDQMGLRGFLGISADKMTGVKARKGFYVFMKIPHDQLHSCFYRTLL